MIELSILKCFFNRKNLESYKDLINPKTLSRQSLIIIKDLEIYFQNRITQQDIDINDFSVFFFNDRHPYLDDKSVTEFKYIFESLVELELSEDIQTLISAFKKQILYEDIKKDINSNNDIEEIESKIEHYKEQNKKENLDSVFNDMDLNSALEFTDRSSGLKWRCKALQQYFDGGVIKSDFILIAGFVGAGKSSFIASEISFMGEQLKDDEYILWLSNEGSYLSLLPRLYSAALNQPTKTIRSWSKEAEAKYKELMKGNKNRIRILDIQGWSAKQIEQLIKKRCPKLAVIDLVDNINGFDKYSNKESSWEKYGKMYQWCREIATQYCPILGVTQLNGDGEDSMYPKMTQLRGSRVEKQAACTALLTIGSIIGDNRTRYLSFPKSKVRADLDDWKAIVQFDAERCRYI